MSNNKGAVVFLAILALAGLGLSGYMFVNDAFLGGSSQEQGTMKLVALWDDLDENTDSPLHNNDQDFLIEFYRLKYLDSDYVTVVNDTCFKLALGLYKVNLNVLLYLVQMDETFWIHLNANNTWAGYFVNYRSPSTSEIDQLFSSSVYINNTSSENLYEINARGTYGYSISSGGNAEYFNQCIYRVYYPIIL